MSTTRTSFQDFLGYRQKFLLPRLCASQTICRLWLGWKPSHKALSEFTVRLSLTGLHSGAPRPWPGEAEGSLRAASGSVPRTKV